MAINLLVTGSILLVLGFSIIVRENLVKVIEQTEQSVGPIQKRGKEYSVARIYRNTFKQWKFFDRVYKIVNTVLILWIGGAAICFVASHIRTELKIVIFVIYFLVVCTMIHLDINAYKDTGKLEHNKFDYFRVFEQNGKMYTILAPTVAHDNGICIATRSYICKKSNGIIWGFLILDDVITQPVPFTGESYLVTVDRVSRVGFDDYLSALYTNDELKISIVTNLEMSMIIENKQWIPIANYRAFSSKKTK